MPTLTTKARDVKESLTYLRKEGSIPAVFYGRKEKSTPISVSHNDFLKVLKEAGESTVITLTGTGVDHEALIHDIDIDPVSGAPRHVDFYVIEKGKKLKIKVELEFAGVSAAVKELGGTLVKVLHEIEIEALPKDLPHSIPVDISKLATMDSQILAGDLVLPAGVALVENPEEVIASVAEAMKEPEVVPVVDIADIEVEKRGKTEEPAEGAEGGDAPAK